MVIHGRFTLFATNGTRRPGFGVVEVIVALVVFAIGALGAAALTAHAARTATSAQRRETAMQQATAMLDSLVTAAAPAAGVRREQIAEYHWTVAADSVGHDIRFEIVLSGQTDTIRLGSRSVSLPPAIGAW